MVHDPTPNRDGDDWSYLTEDWQPVRVQPPRRAAPILQRKIPTWIITLVACIALIVLIVPPLATALKGLA